MHLYNKIPVEILQYPESKLQNTLKNQDYLMWDYEYRRHNFTLITQFNPLYAILTTQTQPLEHRKLWGLLRLKK